MTSTGSQPTARRVVRQVIDIRPLGLPIGIYAATRPYSFFDQVATTLSFIGFLGMSVPPFLLALVLMVLLGAILAFLRRTERREAVRWFARPGEHTERAQRLRKRLTFLDRLK